MNQKHQKALELDKILEMLAGQTGCEKAKALALALTPTDDYEESCRRMQMTSDASQLMARFGAPSAAGLRDCESSLARAARGAGLTAGELLEIARTLQTVRLMSEWKRQSSDQATTLDDLFYRLTPNRQLEQAILDAIISEDEIADTASHDLADIRRKIKGAGQRIRDQLEKIIRSPSLSKFLQEPIITQRDGRYVVPVKAECKNEIKGLVHDTSSSGATFFIEPMAVVEANNEIRTLQAAEHQEILRILAELSAQAGAFARPLIDSCEAAAIIDLQFAKARLAYRMKASVPQITRDRAIVLKKARHPLIDPQKIVPVDISLGREFDTLVITGPNTGGKTVALKTLGLMTLMAHCGLMLPVADGSSVSVFNHVLADIGDEQSIEQSLSTFSGHISNIISILKIAGEGSLVLLDELGAGTDPIEGAALAVAIIERLRELGVRLAATTHYAEIKMYALQTEGVENASCEFDVETLSPTYRLLIGVPGRSNAFAISSRLGLEESVIQRARDYVSTENTRFEDVISSLEQTRRQLEQERQAAQALRAESQQLKTAAATEAKRLTAEREKLLEQARQEARSLVERTKAQTDILLNELEELKKQKDKEEFSKLTAQARAGYKGSINKLREMADPVSRREDESYVLPRALKAGDTVIIADINTEGTVVSGPDANDQYLVQAGIIKTKVPATGLRLVEDAGRRVTVNGRRTQRNVTSKVDRNVSTQVDLRGMAADEAIIELDRFLDNAMLTGVKTVTIIHGKGTGVLRAAVQERLRKQRKLVRSFRPGTYGEGEAGVTIAELH